jgi:hypothetical protein
MGEEPPDEVNQAVPAAGSRARPDDAAVLLLGQAIDRAAHRSDGELVPNLYTPYPSTVRDFWVRLRYGHGSGHSKASRCPVRP